MMRIWINEFEMIRCTKLGWDIFTCQPDARAMQHLKYDEWGKKVIVELILPVTGKIHWMSYVYK